MVEPYFLHCTVRIRFKKDFGSPEKLSYIEFLSYIESWTTVNWILVPKNSFLNPISFLFSSFLNCILTVIGIGLSIFLLFPFNSHIYNMNH